MADGIQYKVRGLESLHRVFKDLPGEVQIEGGKDGSRAGAVIMRAALKREAAARPGPRPLSAKRAQAKHNTRLKSIGFRKNKAKSDDTQSAIRVGLFTRFYYSIHEYNPRFTFMEATINRTAKQAADAVGRGLELSIFKQAGRLAAKYKYLGGK